MKKIRVFESFAGIGTQRMALESIKKYFGVDYESVGISEIDEYALLSYAAIHDGLTDDYEKVDEEIIDDYFDKLNIPINTDNMKRKNLRGKRKQQLYQASKLSKNYGDISKINPEELPDMDLFTYSFPCFVADTLVLTNDGYKKIKDIKVGDKVLTHNRNYRKVLSFYDNGYKDIVSVSTRVAEDIYTTPDHKFLIKNPDSGKLVWRKIKDIKENTYLAMPINDEYSISDTIKKDMKDNPKFYYSLGNIIFNSSVDSGILMSIEKDGIVETMVESMGSLIQESTDSSKVSFYNAYLSYFANNRKIPNYVLDLPEKYLKYFLYGTLLGKSSLKVKNRETAYMLGQCIAKGLRKPYFLREKDGIFTVGIDKSANSHYEDGYIFTPLISKSIKEQEKVYDIEVEEDHSFTVFNIGVHNCTDISVAGKQKGFTKDSNTRSSLLWECEKIIETKKPRYLLMENVKALIFKKNIDGFESWLDILDGLGYNTYYKVLNSKDYGIPQNRERVFAISILKDYDKGFNFPEPIDLTRSISDILVKNESSEKYILPDKVQKDFKADVKTNTDIHYLGSTQPKESGGLGVRYLVYGIEGIMGTLIATEYKQPKQIGVPEKYYVSGEKEEYLLKQIEELKEESTDNIVQIAKLKENNPQRYRVYDKKGISPTINTAQGGGLQPFITDTVFEIRSDEGIRTFKDNVSGAIRANANAGGHKRIYETEKMRIRKIMPIECWRLMGIKDDYFYKAEKYNSDTQLYKQAGNAIVVNVLFALFYELFRPIFEENGGKEDV